jgi:hypothetical protein
LISVAEYHVHPRNKSRPEVPTTSFPRENAVVDELSRDCVIAAAVLLGDGAIGITVVDSSRELE